MTTIIEDNELNAELQELYLKNKQWITDLDFLEKELQFLKDFQQKKLTQLPNKHVDGVELSVRISSTQIAYTALKKELFDFLHQIEALIKKPKQAFNFGLIDTYATLESKTGKSLGTFNKVKEMCLSLNKTVPQMLIK